MVHQSTRLYVHILFIKNTILKLQWFSKSLPLMFHHRSKGPSRDAQGYVLDKIYQITLNIKYSIQAILMQYDLHSLSNKCYQHRYDRANITWSFPPTLRVFNSWYTMGILNTIVDEASDTSVHSQVTDLLNQTKREDL